MCSMVVLISWVDLGIILQLRNGICNGVVNRLNIYNLWGELSQE
jgi:hypothetical protein